MEKFLFIGCNAFPGLEFLHRLQRNWHPFMRRHFIPPEPTGLLILATEAAHRQERVVGFGDPAFDIEKNDADRIDLKGAAKTFLALAQRFLGFFARLHVRGNVNTMAQYALASSIVIEQGQINKIDNAFLRYTTRCADNCHRQFESHKRLARGHYRTEPVLVAALRHLRERFESGTANQFAMTDQLVIRVVGELKYEFRSAKHMQERRCVTENFLQ